MARPAQIIYYSCMSFTTLSIRVEVAKKLRAAKSPGESFSDTLQRLLDNQPARSVGEWLQSLEPLKGHSLFTSFERERLRQDQRTPRSSGARRRVAP